MSALELLAPAGLISIWLILGFYSVAESGNEIAKALREIAKAIRETKGDK